MPGSHLILIWPYEVCLYYTGKENKANICKISIFYQGPIAS